MTLRRAVRALTFALSTATLGLLLAAPASAGPVNDLVCDNVSVCPSDYVQPLGKL